MVDEKLRSLYNEAGSSSPQAEPKVVVAKVVEPKADKIRWAFKKGLFICLTCGKQLKTEKGIVAHVEREHPEA